MNSQQRLIKEIENLPDQRVDQVLDYIAFLKSRHGLSMQKKLNSKTRLDQDWWDKLSQFTPDFMVERNQPDLPKREDVF